MIPNLTARTARFSEDRVHRYRLGRYWDSTKPPLTWLMLNPSIANEEREDPTVKRTIGFTYEMKHLDGPRDFGGVEVVNMFALVSTDPKALLTHPDPVGKNNDHYIIQTCTLSDGLVICAWGGTSAACLSRTHGSRNYALLPGCDREGASMPPTLPTWNTETTTLQRLGPDAMTYKEDCDAIRGSVRDLVIKNRRIHDDTFASFTLAPAPGSKSMLCPIEVTVLPNRHLAVTGDYDTCVFGRYSGNHWRGAISWLASSDEVSVYTMEKASIGMSKRMVYVDKDELVSDLQDLKNNGTIGESSLYSCLDTLATYDSPEQAIPDIFFELEDEIDPDDLHGLGEVPDLAVVASVAVLHRLNHLLNLEEEATKEAS